LSFARSCNGLFLRLLRARARCGLLRLCRARARRGLLRLLRACVRFRFLRLCRARARCGLLRARARLRLLRLRRHGIPFLPACGEKEKKMKDYNDENGFRKDRKFLHADDPLPFTLDPFSASLICFSTSFFAVPPAVCRALTAFFTGMTA